MKHITLVNPNSIKGNLSEYVFDQEAKTENIFNNLGTPLIDACLQGVNRNLGYSVVIDLVCIFAYGQTSSGKTFTMKGDNESPGLIPLALNRIFFLLNQVKISNLALRY
jgi:centromeric protein E